MINDLIYMIETSRHELSKLKAVVKRTPLVERQVSPLRGNQNPILTDDHLMVEFNQQI
jgi:hypothetical protein